MPDLSVANLLWVSAIAFVVPLLLGFFPRVRIPAVVLEIVAGIVVGPSVLGWVEADLAVEVLAVLGLAFLLFVAGLEVELDRLRGRSLRIASAGFGLTFALALGASLLLDVAGVVETPLLVAVIISATSLGVVVPVLKDAGEAGSELRVAVIDTGVGIKPEDFPRLFQEFVQLETTRAQRHEGTGLGLALTKKLVELHGGRIWAASEGEGQGSTFTVILPFGGVGPRPAP